MTRNALVIDVGTSNIKARIYRGTKALTPVASARVQFRKTGNRTELSSAELDRALKNALGPLRTKLKGVDIVVLANQSPSLTVTSKKGELLHPIITHQDRRSYVEAKILRDSFGAKRWLNITGNLPFPGGIAATSLFWLRRNHSRLFSKAHTFGSINSLLIQRWTGNRWMDPANASFMGIFNTLSLKGWNQELADLVGVSIEKLPLIGDATQLAGFLSAESARALGLRSGIPMQIGTMDTSAAVMAVDLDPGDILHIAGTTDVLATPIENPKASETHLTRALGEGRKWLAVRTISAGGATLEWLERIFGKGIEKEFRRTPSLNGVRFDPYLAGDRLSIEPRTGAFHHLTLATTKSDLVNSVIEGIRDQSLEGIRALSDVVRPSGRVWYTGGNHRFARVLHSAWIKEHSAPWNFRFVSHLSLKGLAKIAQKESETL